MLILSRKPGESIVVDSRVVVKIIRLEGDVVKVGIAAPREIPVHRQEVYEQIQISNGKALKEQAKARGLSGAPKPDKSR